MRVYLTTDNGHNLGYRDVESLSELREKYGYIGRVEIKFTMVSTLILTSEALSVHSAREFLGDSTGENHASIQSRG